MYFSSLSSCILTYTNAQFLLISCCLALSWEKQIHQCLVCACYQNQCWGLCKVYLPSLVISFFVSPDHSWVKILTEVRTSFPPLQVQRQSSLMQKYSTAMSTNEFWMPHIDCHLQIGTLTTYIFCCLWYTPYFVFILSRTWHFIGNTWKETEK